MKKTSKILTFIITFVLIVAFSLVVCKVNAQEVENSVTNEEEKTEENELQDNKVDGIFDTEYKYEVYKSSEDKNSYLPFFRFVNERVIFDSKITNMGVTFANKSIEVLEEMKNSQIMFSSDSIRINAPFERGILIANGNITINSNVSQNLLLISPGVITIEENAVVNGDIFVIGNEIEIKGTVKGSILGILDSCSVTGHIDRDLRISTKTLNIATNENILGNIYVETFNNIDISNLYPNAVVKVQEVKETSPFSWNNIFSMITTALILTLVYILITKKSNGKLYEMIVNKLKSNSVFAVLSGTIILLAILPIMFLLLLLSFMGLSVITIPLMIVYIAFVVIVGILDVFIVGSLMYKYIKNKYLKQDGITTDIIGSFVVYFVLSILSIVPYVGGYITLVLLIAANGIVFTSIFKKEKNK